MKTGLATAAVALLVPLVCAGCSSDPAGLSEVRVREGDRPPGDRVEVRAIDANHPGFGSELFSQSLSALSSHLPGPDIVLDFIDRYSDSGLEAETELEAFEARLLHDESELVSRWGSRYGTVLEMVRVELRSVPVRSSWTGEYTKASQLRETLMKETTDARLAGFAGKTLIHVGGYHAQKEHLLGAPREWLGDYLVHRSPAVAGAAITLSVLPARGTVLLSGERAEFDLLDRSPPNELLRIMSETAPNQASFLPLNDPSFLKEAITVNYLGDLRTGPPKRNYDGFVLLPSVHILTGGR